MDWTTVALIALGVIVLLAVLWFVVAIFAFRRVSRMQDRIMRDFDRDDER